MTIYIKCDECDEWIKKDESDSFVIIGEIDLKVCTSCSKKFRMRNNITNV